MIILESRQPMAVSVCVMMPAGSVISNRFAMPAGTRLVADSIGDTTPKENQQSTQVDVNLSGSIELRDVPLADLKIRDRNSRGKPLSKRAARLQAYQVYRAELELELSEQGTLEPPASYAYLTRLIHWLTQMGLRPQLLSSWSTEIYLIAILGEIFFVIDESGVTLYDLDLWGNPDVKSKFSFQNQTSMDVWLGTTYCPCIRIGVSDNPALSFCKLPDGNVRVIPSGLDVFTLSGPLADLAKGCFRKGGLGFVMVVLEELTLQGLISLEIHELARVSHAQGLVSLHPGVQTWPHLF